MKEALLQIAWTHGLYTDLISPHELEVIDPGMHNPHAGADFQNAKIRIDGILWAGNVELHISTKGWRAHKHDQDEGYTSVILHVSLEGEDEVYDSRGRHIPSARLVLSEALISEAERLTSHSGGCTHLANLASLLSQINYPQWLRQLLAERLGGRAAYWLAQLSESQNDHVEVFHRLLFRYFGFGLNNDAMERLARSIPARAIIKQGDRALQLEALILGQAGLLEGLPEQEAYIQLLKQEYAFLKNKYALRPSLSPSIWQLCRTRPASFPLRRLIQLAHLLHSTHLLSSKVLEIKDKAMLIKLLRQEGEHSFWSKFLGAKGGRLRLSAEVCLSLGINVVSTYQLTMARLRPDLIHLEAQAFALLSSLPPENNRIIRQFADRGLTATNAAESGALLELNKNYCQRRKCLYCPIGRLLLASQ